MSTKPIPDDVRRFVLASVPSVPYLEAALLFRREPGRALTAADAARLLYVPERGAQDLLKALCEAGLLAADELGGYRYAPREERVGRLMDALAACYAEDLVGVSNLIHDTTQKNAHRFADAFKLRKET